MSNDLGTAEEPYMEGHTVRGPEVEKQAVKSSVEIFGPNFPTHFNPDPTFVKIIKESPAEKQVEYLMQVVRIERERHMEQEKNLLLQLEELKRFHLHLLKEKEQMRLRVLDAVGITEIK